MDGFLDVVIISATRGRAIKGKHRPERTTAVKLHSVCHWKERNIQYLHGGNKTKNGNHTESMCVRNV